MGAGEFGRREHPVHGHSRVGQGDVLTHGAVEQNVFLQHDADLAAQPRRIGEAEVHPVDQHSAGLGHVEPLDELGQGALARARRADDAEHLAGGLTCRDTSASTGWPSIR